MPDTEPPRLWLRDCNVQLAKSPRQIKEFLEKGEGKNILSMDVETDTLNVFTNTIVGLSMAWDGYEGIYIPTGHLNGSHLNLDSNEVWSILTPTFLQKTLLVFGWHFEGQILPRYGVNTDNYIDMMPAIWLDDMDAATEDGYGLKDSAKKHLDLDVIEITEVPGAEQIDGKKKSIKFEHTHPEEASWYGVQDSLLTYRLYEKKYQQIREQQGTPNAVGFIVDLENRMMGVANRMMEKGIMIDREFLKKSQKDAEQWRSLAEQRLKSKLDRPDLNLDSPALIAERLVEIGVPLPRTKPSARAPQGNPSTEAKKIATMRTLHPQWEYIFQDLDLFRSLGKDAGTYIERLLGATTDENPVIRVKSNVCGAPTGRMSCGGASDKYDDGFARLNAQSIPASHDVLVFQCERVKNPSETSPAVGYGFEDWTGWKGK